MAHVNEVFYHHFFSQYICKVLVLLLLVPVLAATLVIYPATYCYTPMILYCCLQYGEQPSTANFVKYLWRYNYRPIHEV